VTQDNLSTNYLQVDLNWYDYTSMSKAEIAGNNLLHSKTSFVVSESPEVVPLRIFMAVLAAFCRLLSWGV
jgi:hypothetical protein